MPRKESRCFRNGVSDKNDIDAGGVLGLGRRRVIAGQPPSSSDEVVFASRRSSSRILVAYFREAR